MREALGVLAKIHYGKSPSPVLAIDGVVPVVGTGGVYATACRAMFERGVVVARKGSLGTPRLHESPFWPSDTTFAVVPAPGVDLRWLYFNLLSFDLTKLNEATGVPSISRDWLAKISFPKPSIKSQQRIAAILTSLDTAIDATEALIAKHQQIKAGLMHDLFTRGVLATGQLRPPPGVEPQLYRHLRGKPVPATWREIELHRIAQVNRGKFTHRPRNDPKFLGGPFPFIQTGDIAAAAGEYLSDYSQTLSDAGAAVSSCFPAGTIAVTIAANIADTAILSIPMFFPDSVVGVTVGPEADIRFIELSIRLSKPGLEAMAPQSAQKNINLKDLRPLKILLPPLKEQQIISARYEAARRPIAALEATLSKLRTQKLGLMQDLLTGRVRVPMPEPEVTA